MNKEEFIESLTQTQPPAGINDYLRAMWFDRKNDWEAAHKIIQDGDDVNSAWLHGYLHWKEGDMGNADYWYRRAGKKRPATSLQQEWDSIVSALLTNID